MQKKAEKAHLLVHCLGFSASYAEHVVKHCELKRTMACQLTGVSDWQMQVSI